MPDRQKIELVIQLLTLAMDFRAPEAEARTALGKAFEISRAHNIQLYDLKDLITREQERQTEFEQRKVAYRLAAATAIRFGKYKGRTLGSVFVSDPDYLDWLSENCCDRNPILRDRIRTLFRFEPQPEQ